MICIVIFNTKSFKKEIRDPIPKKNAFRDDLSSLFVDLGVRMAGPWEGIFPQKTVAINEFFDFCRFRCRCLFVDNLKLRIGFAV